MRSLRRNSRNRGTWPNCCFKVLARSTRFLLSDDAPLGHRNVPSRLCSSKSARGLLQYKTGSKKQEESRANQHTPSTCCSLLAEIPATNWGISSETNVLNGTLIRNACALRDCDFDSYGCDSCCAGIRSPAHVDHDCDSTRKIVPSTVEGRRSSRLLAVLTPESSPSELGAPDLGVC